MHLINQPAGIEIENPKLQPTAEIKQQETPPWFEHQNLRDERAECFADKIEKGEYSFRFKARTTFVGSFIIPPARVEEMYRPQIFAQTSSDRVVIE